ncbi:hypothetical protein F3087_07175 [Nocardia colli]|uniref:Uncharacterized protein n=1 Tax=Nocardia colli TaxID=2545717 RepID=A0A5N0EIZ0_9NOCA|nr:hypothetical protein [Nocardia colli]KAA8888790.1 hypothetical protein F3087_07175 [Nocardia colli]
MGVYRCTLEQFHIDNTRSRHEDTDTVQFGLRAGDRSFGSRSFDAGDVNNGDHGVGLTFTTVIADPATPVAFSYQIYNGELDELPKDLAATNDQSITAAIDAMRRSAAEPDGAVEYPAGSGLDGSGIGFLDFSWLNVIKDIYRLGQFLFPNCDGFVAAGTVGKNKTAWDRAIDVAGGTTYRQTIRYPGYDSRAGCGSNSDYTVTWSITRSRANGPSLRNFLRENNLTLAPGLRSLTPGEPLTLRHLMH